MVIKKLKLYTLCLSLFLTSNAYSWNSLGHRLVAQIAYHHLTKHAKQVCNRYNHALDKIYRPQNLVNSAVWLDSLRSKNDQWLLEKHYINLPFSLDGTKLQPPNKANAISAIEEAKAVMQSKMATEFDKGFSLRILLHVVGDIHQPLHAASQFSRAHPNGDKGGNLVHLSQNSVATNLHSYWDKGGGFLDTSRSYSQSQLSRKAHNIERHWPCELTKMNFDAKNWASESHQIAVNKVYQLKVGHKPDKKYQKIVKQLTEQRIALAGCRLAATLNKIV